MLLSRHANYLFWFGRYLERTEHTTRFVNIQYYSAIETPYSANKEIVYHSLVNMFGIGNGAGGPGDPEKGLSDLLLNAANPNSILSSTALARTNALNVRNILSVEVWEAINRMDLYVNRPRHELKEIGMDFHFMQRVLEFCSLTRNLINSTLIHDESWAIIRFGIYIERAVQINRILNSQVLSLMKASDVEHPHSARYHMLVTLLKSLQARDMFYKSGRKEMTRQNVADFLVTCADFPRSILYNLDKCQHIYNRIFDSSREDRGGFELNRMTDTYRYLRAESFGEELPEFLRDTQMQIERIAYTIERDHLQV